MQANTTAADYTVEVAGLLKLPSDTTPSQLAKTFADTVVNSWRFRRRQDSMPRGFLWWHRLRHGLPAATLDDIIDARARPAGGLPAAKRRGSKTARGKGNDSGELGPDWVEMGPSAFQREALSEREQRELASTWAGAAEETKKVVYGIEGDWKQREKREKDAAAIQKEKRKQAEVEARTEAYAEWESMRNEVLARNSEAAAPEPPTLRRASAGVERFRSATRKVAATLMFGRRATLAVAERAAAASEPSPELKGRLSRESSGLSDAAADDDSSSDEEPSDPVMPLERRATAGTTGISEQLLGAHQLGDRVFITFRYAADASQAVWAFRGENGGTLRLLMRRVKKLLTCRWSEQPFKPPVRLLPPRHLRPRHLRPRHLRPRHLRPLLRQVPLKVHRAPEADDLLWENITLRGSKGKRWATRPDLR